MRRKNHEKTRRTTRSWPNRFRHRHNKLRDQTGQEARRGRQRYFHAIGRHAEDWRQDDDFPAVQATVP